MDQELKREQSQEDGGQEPQEVDKRLMVGITSLSRAVKVREVDGSQLTEVGKAAAVGPVAFGFSHVFYYNNNTMNGLCRF